MRITRAMHIGAVSVCSALALLIAGCSSDDGSASTDSAAATSTTTTEATTTTTARPPVDPVTGAGAPEVVADGYQFLEGVTWRADDETLLFTDIGGAQLIELDADGQVTVVEPTTTMADIDGDGAGGLIATEPTPREVTHVTADGSREVLADSLNGVDLSSPNGVAAASDGTVWFTDFGPGAPRPLGYRGVFRVSPQGAVTAEVQMDPAATAPNGIALSPDQRTLYVSDTLGGGFTAYAIGPDGGLADATDPVWVAAFDGFPDGICVDATGNIFVIGGGPGVAAYAPDGTPWGTIALPDPEAQPTNCAVGGDDGRTLFVTTSTTLYRIALG